MQRGKKKMPVQESRTEEYDIKRSLEWIKTGALAEMLIHRNPEHDIVRIKSTHS